MRAWVAAVIIISMAGAGSVVESGGVRIEVSVNSQIYTWTVHNLTSKPILSVEIGCSGTYRYTTPEGWEHEGLESSFMAWALDGKDAIQPGRSGAFTARVSSGGAPLGDVAATIVLDGEEQVVFDRIWGPSPKPRSIPMLIVTVLCVLGVGHVLLLRLLERRRTASG